MGTFLRSSRAELSDYAENVDEFARVEESLLPDVVSLSVSEQIRTDFTEIEVTKINPHGIRN